VCLISEEVEAKKYSLEQIVDQICVSVSRRAEDGNNFGVVLIPEGLVEFIPEIKVLIHELNDAIAGSGGEFAGISSFIDQMYWLGRHISDASYKLLQKLPPDIARQFLMDRDPHGNVQVSRIETEKLLAGMVDKRLQTLREIKLYSGKFNPLTHFFGYEGRCAFPTNFDADYCYTLGFSAFILIASGLTGYISSVSNLNAPASQWIAGGVPLTMMMNIEHRHGSKKPVIRKALVDLNGGPFKAFAAARDTWAVKTSFLYPGAIQYYGPDEICNQPTITLKLEHDTGNR
ncbi:MAG: diphosphate--fructose-6-phosphate 1-phosphotransferase, partial [Treponema sp.]|nr:diphosphate--fructose-6-phosphate 1-phosphotransferase [Treponema sp.]